MFSVLSDTLTCDWEGTGVKPLILRFMDNWMSMTLIWHCDINPMLTAETQILFGAVLCRLSHTETLKEGKLSFWEEELLIWSITENKIA